jgi:hypothetical protein
MTLAAFFTNRSSIFANVGSIPQLLTPSSENDIWLTSNDETASNQAHPSSGTYTV